MHRSRSRERPRGACDPRSTAGCDPLSYEFMNAEGYVKPRSYIKQSRIELGSKSLCGSPTESNSITFDFKSSSSKKETRTPIRVTLAEEMSIEKQIKRSSPSVIAKLMGLDALPSPGSLKPQKEVSSCSRKVSSKEMQMPIRHDDCLLKKHSDEYQDCKDKYEVINGTKFENHKNHVICKQTPNLKQSGMDMAFIRQSFINAKRLSTDEKLQRSKEFDDALEVLESNKDLFLKLLQEPNSLFSKHLQNQSHSPPSPHASHASIRKPSKDNLTANRESPLRSEIIVGRYTNPKNRYSQSLWQHVNNSNGHPFREPFCSFPVKYSDSIYGGKVEDNSPPTHIVILKPGLTKARKVERTVQSVKSLENSKYGALNHRELSEEKVMELYLEERDRQELHTLENMRLRTKPTTELTKNVKQHMRKNSATGMKASFSKYNNYVQDDDMWPMSSISDVKNSLTSFRTYDNLNEYGESFSPSPSHALESSVSMESSKQLSEQRRMTRHLHEIGLSMRASNTLSEMLALSDKDISARDASIVKKFCPAGISSKDGWKDEFSRNLSRSKSLPASYLVYENFQHNSRNGVFGSKSRNMPKNIRNMSSEPFVDEVQVSTKNSSVINFGDRSKKIKLHSDVEANKLPVREIHVSTEEFKHRSNVGPIIEEERAACNYPDIVDFFSVPSCNIAEPSFSMKNKGLGKSQKIPSSERNGKLVECGHSEILSKLGSSDHGGHVLLSSNCSKSRAVSPICYKEGDQPSPVSVLDLSSNDDKSTSGCFKKINADLQELRRQLQLLKFDSENNFAKEIEAFISSDEDAVEPFSQLGDIHQSFRDEEDRDYSYLLDLLIDSGLLKSERSGLFGACHLAELPVGLDVLDKLEKKYKSVESWSRSERRLLFDLVNYTIADIAAKPFVNMRLLVKPSLFLQSKKAHEGLVEEIWQAVVKRRKEASSYSEEDQAGPKLFDFQNGESELVGRDLENMLSENLMDELLEELIFM